MLCNTPVRRAILAEPALPATLTPLSLDGGFAGLSLLNHALVERQLEDLARAGITDVELLHRGSEARGAGLAALGARWGMQLSVRAQPAAPTAEAAAPTLFLRMDCWPGADGLQALLLGSCMPVRRLAGPAGPLPCHVSHAAGEASGSLVYCRDARLLGTLEDYWFASLELLGRLAATNHLEREFAGGQFIGAGARLHRSARVAGPCLIGSGAYVGKRCVVGPRSIIGDGAYLDAGVRITDSIVLGDCHVDHDTELHGVIVCADEVLCWRSGRRLEFDRTVVLANRWSRLSRETPGRADVTP